VNLQCWPGVADYKASVCDNGLCCTEGCVPYTKEMGNSINDWPLTTSGAYQCTDANTSQPCQDAIPLQVHTAPPNQTNTHLPKSIEFLPNRHCQASVSTAGPCMHLHAPACTRQACLKVLRALHSEWGTVL